MNRAFAVLFSLLFLSTSLFGSTALAGSFSVGSGTELDGFPLRLPGKNLSDGILVYDLDEDGVPEIITSAGSLLIVLDSKGSYFAPFPIDLSASDSKIGITISSAPTLCDLNGDGKKELIVATSNRLLHAIRLDGEAHKGFPIRLDGLSRAPATCFPTAKKKSEILLSTDSGSILRIKSDGGLARVFAKISKGAESGIGLGDLDGDGSLDIIAVGGNSRLYVFNRKGKLRKGFPYRMSFRTSGIPSIGDINDDGKPDIILGSLDFKIHAVNRDGKSLAGFPVTTGYRIYGGVALGDINQDGVLDVIAGSGDKKLYVLDGSGQSLSGYPKDLGHRLASDPVVGDIDQDGKMDIVVTSVTGGAHLLWGSGKSETLGVSGKPALAPALADFDGDDRPEVVIAGREGWIHLLKFPKKGGVKRALIAWPMMGHGPGHSGLFGPNEARFSKLSFENIKPTTTENIKIKYAYYDLDWEPEKETRIRWFLNGKAKPELNDKREVPFKKTKKHQKWHYTLQGSENFLSWGLKSPMSRIFVGDKVEVINTAPAQPKIVLSPQTPQTTDTLTVTISEESPDPDGDKIKYSYIWLRDRLPTQIPTHQTSVSPSKTKKHEMWRVVVIPNDGEENGASESAVVTLINTPPQSPEFKVSPASPRITDEIKVLITKEAPDMDQDKISYRYEYWVNGEPFPLQDSSAHIFPSQFKKNQKIKIRVTPHDDQESGEAVEHEFSMVNTSPDSPTIEIQPSAPRSTDTLHAAVVAQRSDDDGDELQWRHKWFKNNVPQDLPKDIDHKNTLKGEIWRLEIIPFDGETEGAKVGIETLILNTPPTQPLLTLEQHEFFTDQVVHPKTQTPSADADADTIALKWKWFVDGKRASFPESKTQLEPSDIRKNQTWSLTVTPHDGEVDGLSSKLKFKIKNTRPTSPKIVLSNTQPTTRDRVEVSVVQPSLDKDGDSLIYHYRWYRNGVFISDWPLTKNYLAPLDAKKSEYFRVEVRAFDTEEEGHAAFAELRIINHMPEAPRVKVSPVSPKTTDDLLCLITQPAKDVDGDSLRYEYLWFVDGQRFFWQSTNERLSAANTHKGQKWHCQLKVTDGELSPPVAKASPVTVQNTKPRPAAISIRPKAPKTGDDLVCEFIKTSVDVDQDLINYRFTWVVDGKAWESPASLSSPNRVSSNVTKRGQNWICSVLPTDDESEGESASTATAIVNTPPLAPVIQIEPQNPEAGDELRCVILTPGTDADADKISYDYVWWRNERRQSFASISQSVPGRTVKTGDNWRCHATPRDAVSKGKPIRSEDVNVRAQ